ncbi:unnamed protein product, partial [Mesorhabditis spiculigera]
MPRVAEKLMGTFEPRSQQISPVGSITSPTSEHGHPRRMTIVETEDGNIEVSEGFVDIIQEANVDGVRHLKGSNGWSRALWIIIILLFIVLALYQIYSQISFFWSNPVATDIEAEYPNSVQLPAVAICNNNQYRLTYITNARHTRKPTSYKNLLTGGGNSSIFDQILQNIWDKDAVTFFRKAAHMKTNMILKYEVGLGICYVINSDPHNPVRVSGSGSGHGLQLLLNVESYERIEACTPYFKARAQAGLKILIYNQTDIPESTMNGVNVPPGYSMDIPFKMQHRHKIPSAKACLEETEENKRAAAEDFFSPDNIRTCAIRIYVQKIEKFCDCTIRHAFPQSPTTVPFRRCNIDDYFGCVERAISKVRESGDTASCLPPCESIDYTAWQDMNRLPTNIMPPVIDEDEEEDEQDVIEDEDEEIDRLAQQIRLRPVSSENKTEFFVCDGADQLSDNIVKSITRVAKNAFEKQSRFQDDIHLKTKRLIAKLLIAKNRLISNDWGWKNEEFVSVYQRLNTSCPCFSALREKHSEVVIALTNPPAAGEENKAHQLHMLLDEHDNQRQPERFKAIGDMKAVYGDNVETSLKQMELVADYIGKLWAIFVEKNFHVNMNQELGRMDRILELMNQYDHGKLHRKTWADKMQSRSMRHFFEEEFYDNWYQPIHADLQQKIQKVLNDAEQNEWKKMEEEIKDGHVEKIGSVLYFGKLNYQNATRFRDFLVDLRSCLNGEVNATSLELLNGFKKGYKEFQSAYNNLYKKELPSYLENFDFDTKFESDNFAMVNIYLSKMNLERWRQKKTYTFWSLACDIGGALGLFLGASLLTLIELLYLCFHYGFCHEGVRKIKRNTWVRKITNAGPATPPYTTPRSGRASGAGQKSNGETPKHSSLWSNPLAEPDLESGLASPRKSIVWSEDLKASPNYHDHPHYHHDETVPHSKEFSVIPEADEEATSPRSPYVKSVFNDWPEFEPIDRNTTVTQTTPAGQLIDRDFGSLQASTSSEDETTTASLSRPTLFHPHRFSNDPAPEAVAPIESRPSLASPEADLTSPDSGRDPDQTPIPGRKPPESILFLNDYGPPDAHDDYPAVHRTPNYGDFDRFQDPLDDEEDEEEGDEATPMLRAPDEYRDAISASPELESSISESFPHLFARPK